MPTYTHNDYYGYINKIQEKAITNPEWFWSDKASEARQWLYNNNAGKIVDEIYEHTPDDIKSRIDPKMLSNKTQTDQLTRKIHEGQNRFLDTAGAVGLQSAGTVGLGIAATLNPVATAGALLLGGAASKAVDKATNRLSDGKYEDWGSFVRNNKDYGQTGNIVASMTNPGAWIFGGLGYKGGNWVNKKLNIPTPERWTRAMEDKFREDWSSWIDDISTFKNLHTDHINLGDMVYPIEFDSKLYYKIMNDPAFYPSGKVILTPLRERAALARKANWSYNQAQKVLDFYNAHSKNPNSKGIILQEDLGKSFNRGGISHIGVTDPKEIHIYNYESQPSISHNFTEVAGHELEHGNPTFNTPRPIRALDRDSPFYGFDYSGVDETYQQALRNPSMRGLFRRKRPLVNEHDQELTEQHSDAFGVRTDMYLKGIGKDGALTPLDVLRYRLTRAGWKNRFLIHHPGLRNQTELLNESAKYKSGGKLNG